jgi:transposase
LLRAQLLHMFFSVRSERLLIEEIDYSIFYRWFVELNLADRFGMQRPLRKNRDRLLEVEFLAEVVERAREG